LKKTVKLDARRVALRRARRIVVKVGSAVIAQHGRLRPKTIADLAYEVTVLQHRGYEVVMVVSGAVAAGYQPLGLAKPPKVVLERQAAASIGQPRLMAMFATAFGKHRVHVAQLLMSAIDIDHRRRFLSARHTLLHLLGSGVVPIINENDALSDDEVSVGDNDHLAALVSHVVSADLLVILSSVDGLLENGQPGHVIPYVEVGSSVDDHISNKMSSTGVGGMSAKVSAARIASDWGIPTVIAGGETPEHLRQVLAGEEVGTLFVPRERKVSSRKRWIAARTRSSGVLVIDAGARRAVLEKGASLLPSGIRDVQGEFDMGARVEIHDERGNPIAYGLVSYSSADIARIKGKKSQELESILGYQYVPEVVNRDDMAVLD
jgi:glutamate 5-kinase